MSIARWEVFQGGDEHIAFLSAGWTIAVIKVTDGRWKAGAFGELFDDHTYGTVDAAKAAAIARAQMLIDEAAAQLRALTFVTGSD